MPRNAQVYITGPEKSDNAILCVFDIFGLVTRFRPFHTSHPCIECHHESDSFKPQTQLGADILASCLNTRVFMPNFFYPAEPISLDNFPPQTDEQKQALQDFFGGTANPPKTVGKVDQAGEALKKDGYKKLVVYGLCWGGYRFG